MLKEQEYYEFQRRDTPDDPRHTQSDYNTFETEQLAVLRGRPPRPRPTGRGVQALSTLDTPGDAPSSRRV
jgi:hypothetical protein